jgi:hypothetical protein
MTFPRSFIGFSLMVLALLGSLVAEHHARAADPIPPNTSGIALSGRTADEKPLYSWQVFDAAGKKEVAAVDGKWGFTPLPPGSIASKCDSTLIVDWANVTVKPNEAAEMKSIRSSSWGAPPSKPVYGGMCVRRSRQEGNRRGSESGITPLPPR